MSILFINLQLQGSSVGAKALPKRDDITQAIFLMKNDSGDCYIGLKNIQGCTGTSSIVGTYDEGSQKCIKKEGTPREGSNQGQGDICDGATIMLYYQDQSTLWSAGDAHFDDNTGNGDDDNGNTQDFQGLGFDTGCGLFEEGGEWTRVCGLQ